MFDLEQISENDFFLAGTDEVGRGPLAGPVVAATVYVSEFSFEDLKVFLENLRSLGVTDSKKLDRKKREKLLNKMGLDVLALKTGEVFELPGRRNFKCLYSLHEVSPALIDEINILNAALLCMEESFKKCRGDSSQRGILLIDGNKALKHEHTDVRTKPVVKGDQKSFLIGLASILAKVYRDILMDRYAKEYPGYDFEKHAGYPTKAHLAAISQNGVTPIHRKTFKGVKEFV